MSPSSPTDVSQDSGGGLTVAEYLVRSIERLGATHVFAVPGGPLLHLYEALCDSDKQTVVLAKHEEGAAFMAEGYAQTSGQVGVVCTTSGPGALHALTAAASATSDSVPLLVVTAQTETSLFGRGSLQDSSGGNWAVDSVDAFKSATKLSTALAHPRQFPRLLRRALATACSGRPGAVHLSLPADLLPQPTGADLAEPLPDPRSLTPAVEPAAVRELASALRQAEHGVVLAGQGAKLSGAAGELLGLAEHLSWPVATTMKGKSALPEDHPAAVGVFGFSGSPRAHEAVLDPRVDTLLVVGSGLGEMSTGNWTPELVAGRTVCRIDIDALQAAAGFDADATVIGDARPVLRELLRELGAAPASLTHDPARRRPAAPTPDGTPLPASAVVAAMSDLLPSGTTVFADNGNCLGWLGEFFVSRSPGGVHVSLNVASMGYSAGAAVGGGLAGGGREPVVALTGDAAFAMGGMEIHTAAEMEVPVIWVVLNNSGNAMVQNVQEGISARSVHAMYRTPMNVAAIGQGLGADGKAVHTLPEFTAALTDALRRPGPSVLDVRVDPDEVPWALSGRIRALQGAASVT